MAFLSTVSINPQDIISKFSYYQTCSHFYHLTTTSYEEHKALEKLYDGVNDLKDEIIEMLFGYVPRVTTLKVEPTMTYKGLTSSIQLAKDVRDFASQGEVYSDSNKWSDLSNKFQELKGLATHVVYLLSLS